MLENYVPLIPKSQPWIEANKGKDLVGNEGLSNDCGMCGKLRRVSGGDSMVTMEGVASEDARVLGEVCSTRVCPDVNVLHKLCDHHHGFDIHGQLEKVE